MINKNNPPKTGGPMPQMPDLRNPNKQNPPKTGGPMPRVPTRPGGPTKPAVPGVVQAMKEKMAMKGKKY